jgi:ABC-2 type transport system permease protein
MTVLMASMTNETRKGLLILWDYKFSLMMEMLSIFLVFLGAMFLAGQGSVTQAQVSSTILGFIITFYALGTLSNMSYSLMSEAQAGTLEQMYMSPAPSQLIVLGRSFSGLISTTIQLLILLTVMMTLFRVRFAFPLDAVAILLITMVGLLGFGYVMGGLTLVFKQIGPLSNILGNFIFIANGTFLPVEFMPTWLATFVKFIPSTLGIIALRRVVLEGETLATLIQDGSLTLLTGYSIAFFVLGWFLYALCENVARRQGSLAQY